MYVTIDQLVRWDGRLSLKLLVCIHIVSLNKSCSQILLDTFSNLALPFGASGGRRKQNQREG